jgi:hypothetical protein
LSHLRFYGDPVVIERSTGGDSDRLTAQELRLLPLGASSPAGSTQQL